MNKETILQLLNTLNQIEIKGFQNVSYLCGVMNILQKELNKPDKVGDIDGKSKE